MSLSTLLFFIVNTSAEDERLLSIEDVSLLSYPDITDYLDRAEVNVRDSVVQEILAKVKH